MIRGPEKNPRGGGEAGRYSGQLRGRGGETGALNFVERMVGAVGASKVAHHRAPGEGGRVLDYGSEFASIEAEPRHAGIDMEDGGRAAIAHPLSAPGGGKGWGEVGDSREVADTHLTLPIAPRWVPSLSPLKGGEGIAQTRPLLDLPGLVQYRDQLVRCKFGRRTRQRAVEDGDLGDLAEGVPQRDPLVERRDEKHPATGCRERERHRRGAEAIAIRLDHRGALRGRGLPRQQPPIGGDPGEVDFEDGAGARRRVGGHAHRFHDINTAERNWCAASPKSA